MKEGGTGQECLVFSVVNAMVVVVAPEKDGDEFKGLKRVVEEEDRVAVVADEAE